MPPVVSTSVSEPAAGRDYAFGLTYHPSGALRTYTGGNLIQTTIGFDQHRYWVRSITSAALQLTYDNYDNVGNVRTIGDPRFGAQTFTYDALDRLATAAGAYGSSAFAYDAHGNRQGSAYQYEAGSLRLTNQNGTAFTYDNNGNMRTAGSATYTYSPQNMLASAAVVGGTATYVYDTDLQRIKKSFGGSTTYFVRGLGGELLTEWKDPRLASGTIRDFIYAGSRLVSAVEKSTSVDPNANCGMIQPDGPPVTVTIASGQIACVNFTAVVGRRYALVGDEIGDWGCPFQPLRFYKPDGTSFWGVDMCSDAFLETPVMTEPGTYAILVDPSQAYSGTVQLTLYEVDDEAAGTLVVNDPAVPLSLTVAQVGRFTFAGTAGQQVTVRLAANTMGYTTVKLLRPDQSTLTSNSSSGSSFNLTTQTLSSSGDYTVLIDPSGSNTGSISVRVTNP